MEANPPPPFVPPYNKPEEPGIFMGFDNTVGIRHVVGPEARFEHAAQALFGLVREAQERFPGWPRVLYVDVAGHRGSAAGFTPEMYELQQEFLFSVLAPFLSAFETPLTGPLVNPEKQRDDLPDRLDIGGDGRAHAGQVIPDAPEG